MQKFPHHYHASAQGEPAGIISTHSDGLTPIDVAAPKEFDGPGDKWSPEELLVGSVANCFILTFRAISTVSKLEWSDLSCEAKGVLEMVDRKIQFTEMFINASLKINSQEDEEKALQLLEKAEKSCLITNSLSAQTHLETKIIITM